MLLLLKFAVVLINLGLPLYVVAISLIASTFSIFAYRRFDTLIGSIIYFLITITLGSL